MSYNLLTIQGQDSPPEDDGVNPIFRGETWVLQMAENETVLWQGNAPVRAVCKNSSDAKNIIWELNDTTKVIVTDRRIVYICQKYIKGDVWLGGGLAVALNIVSSALAAYHRRGKAAVGQIRFQWPLVVTSDTDTRIVRGFSSVGVVCRDKTREIRLNFGISKQKNEEVAHLLVKYIAQFRLDHNDGSVNPQALTNLKENAGSPKGRLASKDKYSATVYSLYHAKYIPNLK